MKKMKLLLILAITASLYTSAGADSAKGKRIYQKFMKEDCNLSGGKVALKHTQKEWKKLKGVQYHDELLDICPKSKKFLDSNKFRKYQKHLKDFTSEFAKGSGNIPAC